MSSLPVTLLTASILGLLLVILSGTVVRLRLKHKIGIGHGNNARLERACRVQGNFTEYAPMALVLIAALELSGASMWLLASTSAALVGGRCLHAIGLYRSGGASDPRFYGTALTWLSILGSSLSGMYLLFA